MKRHVQEPGIRKWSGNDLLDLQGEPLKILDAFFSQWGDCVICGCETTEDTLAAGLVSIEGLTLPVLPTEVKVWPVYLVAAEEHVQREYADDVVRDIAVNRYADVVYTKPDTGVAFIELTQEGPRGFFEGMRTSWLTNLKNAVISYKGQISNLQKADIVLAGKIDDLTESGKKADKRIGSLESYLPAELDHIPGESDDTYRIGQEVWVENEDGSRTFYKCHDNTKGAAVWKESGIGSGTGSGGADSNGGGTTCNCDSLSKEDILAILEGRDIEDGDDDCDCAPLSYDDIMEVLGTLSPKVLAGSDGMTIISADGNILKTKN